MRKDRRRFFHLTAAAALTGCKRSPAPSEAGATMRPYGERAPTETAERLVREATLSPGAGSSRTPLQDLHGTLTPSALHFERHHAGVPAIDPARHQLLIHGLVERPTIFTVDEIRRFPSVTRAHFLECAGNGGDVGGNPPPTVQQSHGLLSCSEWTGVRLSLLLAEAKLKPEAKWLLAEGADACRMGRSVPVEKALDDALVVYAQNGEAIRPEQGYPLRLLLPGWEGNANVKWLHRLHAIDQPAMTSRETAYYTDLMPDGKARIFSFEMEARSVITRPSGGQKLTGGPGFYEITGLAWSGRGKISQVEVSTDGGATWRPAELQEPVLSKSVTRFRAPWEWNGQPATIQSRCTDETGYLQPTRDEIVAVRGAANPYHYHGIKIWHIQADGSVTSV